MLNILLAENYTGECIDDIEVGFVNHLKGGIKRSPVNELLLRDIEGAEYHSPTIFKKKRGDGYEYIDSLLLSTGCKGALLVANQPLPVDFLECGYNARDAVIRNCESGTLLTYDTEKVTRKFDEHSNVIDEDIDVCFEGHKFTKLSELNHFLDYGDW